MDKFGRTEVFYTINEKDEAKFFELITPDEVNRVDGDGVSLMHFAVVHKQSNILAYILEHGGNTEVYDRFGNGPLWHATFNARGDYEIVKLLLKYGANAHHKNEAGRSPYDFANTIADKELLSIFSANK